MTAVLRPAGPDVRAQATIRYRAPNGPARWRTSRHVRPSGTRNIVSTSVGVRRGGLLRVAYGKLRARTVPIQ